MAAHFLILNQLQIFSAIKPTGMQAQLMSVTLAQLKHIPVN